METMQLQWMEDPKKIIAENGCAVKAEEYPDFVDVSGVGGVLKKKIKDGEGENPKEGSICSIHYSAYTTADDYEFENTKTGKAYTLDFNVGTGMVISGIDLAVSGMQTGEVAEYIFDPAYAWREEGKPPHVPADAVVRYEIELVSFENEPTKREKLDNAIAAKNEGNAYFKDHKYSEARRCYKQALTHTGKFKWYDPNPSILEEQMSVQASLYNNITLCHIKEGSRQHDIIAAASDCLKVQPTHCKCLVNRAKAYIAMEEFEKAKQDLDMLMKHHPEEEKEAEKVRNSLQVAEKKCQQKQKEVFSKMMGA